MNAVELTIPNLSLVAAMLCVSHVPAACSSFVLHMTPAACPSDTAPSYLETGVIVVPDKSR